MRILLLAPAWIPSAVVHRFVCFYVLAWSKTRSGSERTLNSLKLDHCSSYLTLLLIQISHASQVRPKTGVLYLRFFNIDYYSCSWCWNVVFFSLSLSTLTIFSSFSLSLFFRFFSTHFSTQLAKFMWFLSLDWLAKNTFTHNTSLRALLHWTHTNVKWSLFSPRFMSSVNLVLFKTLFPSSFSILQAFGQVQIDLFFLAFNWTACR